MAPELLRAAAAIRAIHGVGFDEADRSRNERAVAAVAGATGADPADHVVPCDPLDLEAAVELALRDDRLATNRASGS